ncbi:MAG TPA: hypothetical protein VI854_03075, partial [Acidimicrobiia bacterium]|nr:hypothetical protein [Acidimicrobiia bacterium]
MLSSPPPGDGSPDDPRPPRRPRLRSTAVLAALITGLLTTGSAVAVDRTGAALRRDPVNLPAPADLPAE